MYNDTPAIRVVVPTVYKRLVGIKQVRLKIALFSMFYTEAYFPSTDLYPDGIVSFDFVCYNGVECNSDFVIKTTNCEPE